MKPPKQKTPEEALAALTDRCAKAELCLSDARRLMLRWGVVAEEQEKVLAELLCERFIDEERYAGAFVRDKLNFSRWGARKIGEALYAKRIPPEIVRRALEQTAGVEMADRLESDLRRKNNALQKDDPRKRREKLLRFGLSRGYDFDTIRETIGRLVPDDEE